MEFISKSIIENGCEKVNYFIDNKEVDEKTYYDTQEDVFLNSANQLNLKWKNVISTPEINALADKKEEFIDNLLDEILSVDKQTAIAILIDEFDFRTKQAYFQAQIDLNRIYAKMMKTNLRTFENELEDLMDEYDKEDEEDE